MLIKTNKMLFVTDSDDSGEYTEVLRSEFGINCYKIIIDRTTHCEYFQLFHEFKSGKRLLHKELFASSKLEKIVRFIDENI